MKPDLFELLTGTGILAFLTAGAFLVVVVALAVVDGGCL